MRTPHLAAALMWAGRGWHVFPLVPSTKRPAVDCWEERATTDPDRIRRAWASDKSEPYGIGIACGPSRLVVVDLDVPKPTADGRDVEPPVEWADLDVRTGLDVFAELHQRSADLDTPATFTIRTGSGGYHLYFAAPADDAGPQLRNTAGALGWLIDTRAAGGYVVAAPTVVEGRAYVVVAHDTPVAPLPAWIATALRPRPLPAPTPSSGRTAPVASGGSLHPYVAAAIDGQRRHIAAAPVGRRNHALYVSAVALGQLIAGGALDEDHAVAQLLDAAAGHFAAGAYSDRQARQTIASGFRAGARRPRSVPPGRVA
jgi:hypothetical protein